jgi:hypothetical protein
MSDTALSGILRRIARQTGVDDLASVLADLEPADLHALLLAVQRRRAARRTPAAVLSEFASGRFARPGNTDPRRLLEWDRVAFAALPDGFEPVELSPVCPLGTSSAVATVSPDKALATTRPLEVVSDATNVLALACALRRRALLRTDAKSSAVVRLAASHRLLRPQSYADPRLLRHFRLFHLCTAGRDTGANRFEATSLAEHVRFYLRALTRFVGRDVPLQVLLTDLATEPPRALWDSDVLGALGEEFPGVRFGFDPARTTGRGYYRDVCFHIHAVSGGEPIELADGGAVAWTAKLLSNAKERLFISGIGSERVCALAGA